MPDKCVSRHRKHHRYRACRFCVEKGCNAMASLMELIERVNKGEMIDPVQLEVYQDSSNSAEKFLAHHARAMLDLRQAQQHMMQSLEAIDYSDQKVLSQFMSISSFLGLTDRRAQPVVKFGAAAIGRKEFALGL